MGSKKGQLFLVAIVFLIGMVFIIQQSLFQYTSLDLSRPFKTGEFETVRNVVDVINETIIQTPNCDETKDSFENRIEDMRSYLFEEQGKIYSFYF